MKSRTSYAMSTLDFVDVIVHVMRADIREKYDLESLWGDAPRVRTRKKTTAASE